MAKVTKPAGRGRPQNPDARVIGFTVRIPPSLKDRVVREAKRIGVSRDAFVRMALIMRLEQK
jgi:predicted HicB family RNase H-like nuclease